ncbi:MAG TPA: hypothetical protein PKY81_06555 [bacterium]|nr:hypothetical protein [bacterium]
MKALIIIVLALALAFYTVKWFTAYKLPEMRRLELCKAAKDFFEEKKKMPKSVNDLLPYTNNEPPKELIDASWYIDPKDKEEPVKIYKWKFYKCPNDNVEIAVTDAVRPISISCPTCLKKYYVTESELYSKDKESPNFYFKLLNDLFIKKEKAKNNEE